MEPTDHHSDPQQAHRLTGPIAEPITTSIIVSAIFAAASFGISMLASSLLGKQSRPRTPFDDRPTTLSQRGSMLPVIFGRRRTGYVFAWSGQRGAGKRNGINVYFEAGWHQLCIGPAHALHGIYENGKPIFDRTITRQNTPSGSVLVCSDGSRFAIYWGECDQPVNGYLAQGGTDRRGRPLYPGVRSRWPNVCYVLWNKKRLGFSAQWPSLTYELECRVESNTATLTRSSPYIPMSTLPNPSASIPGGGAVVLIGNVPAGTYTLDYLAGALKYSSRAGTPYQLHQNDRTRNSWRIVNARGATVALCPGNGLARGTQAEIETANAGATRSVTWSGGNLYLRLVDSNLKDNIDGSPNPTFRLSGAGGTFTVIGAVRAGVSSSGSADDGANPAHVLWQLLTARFPHGLGLAADWLDGESFERLGELCASERLAINVASEGTQDSRQLVQNIMADVSLLLPQVGVRISARPIRASMLNVPTVSSDHTADGPPSRRVLHGSLMADRVTHYIRNRLRGYRSDDLGGEGDIDQQAARNGRLQARQVELYTITDRITGSAVARRRSLESSAETATVTFNGLRDTSALVPGDPFILEGSQYRVLSIKRGLLSPANPIKASLDQYGRAVEQTPLDGRDDDSAASGLPEVDPASYAFILPDELRPVAAGRWLGVLRIRNDGSIDSGTAHLSANDVSYTLLGSAVECTGGILNSSLPDTFPTDIAIGPSITALGPDIDTVLDLTGRDAEYEAGVQLALIGDELFLLRRVTAVSGGYRLEGLRRARYGTIAATHSDNTPVFIFTRATLNTFSSPLLIPGATVYVKVLPVSGESTLELEDDTAQPVTI